MQLRPRKELDALENHRDEASHVDPMATDTLVAAAVRGDALSFERLVRRLHPVVFRWALYHAADGDEAEDVAQETFVIALRHLGQYRGIGTFHTWLYRVTARAAGRIRRRRANRARLDALPKAQPDVTVYTTDPGARVDRERLILLVRRCWEDLPARQRAVLDLVDLQGYSPAEAAEMLELNPASLRSNLFKARRALRSRVLAERPGLAATGERGVP